MGLFSSRLDKSVPGQQYRKVPQQALQNIFEGDRRSIIGMCYPASMTYQQCTQLMGYLLSMYLQDGGAHHLTYRETLERSNPELASLWMDNLVMSELTQYCDTEEELIFVARLTMAVKFLIHQLLERLLSMSPQQELHTEMLVTPYNVMGFHNRESLFMNLHRFYAEHNANSALQAIKSSQFKRLKGAAEVSDIPQEIIDSMPPILQKLLFGKQAHVDPNDRYKDFLDEMVHKPPKKRKKKDQKDPGESPSDPAATPES